MYYMKKEKEIPNFLYIGVARAGSSWLYECLREHPQVFVSTAKDINYFSYNYDMGKNWYLSFFKGSAAKLAVGELSHDYYLSVNTARKILQMLPDVKLICCLREPVDRMISNLLFTQRFLGKNINIDRFLFKPVKELPPKKLAVDLERNLNIDTMQYYEKLKPFYELFPAENILILFYDGLKDAPAVCIRRVYSFIGVDKYFLPRVLY